MISPLSPINEIVRRIVLAGTIREDSAHQFLEQLTLFEHLSLADPVTIYIDTYGGDLHSSFMIHDAIRMCGTGITTVGIGKVMSAGVLILSAGDKGFRFLTKNTKLMVHEISAGVVGSCGEMEREVNESKNSQNLYIELLAEYSGQSKEKIKNMMEATTYLTAEQAVAMGFADKILSFKNRNVASNKVVKKIKKVKGKK